MKKRKFRQPETENLVLQASTADDPSLPKPIGLLDPGPLIELQATENGVPLLLKDDKQRLLPLEMQVE
jgi:hypothetical protein